LIHRICGGDWTPFVVVGEPASRNRPTLGSFQEAGSALTFAAVHESGNGPGLTTWAGVGFLGYTYRATDIAAKAESDPQAKFTADVE
jgi:hypothetical protein